MGYDPDIHHRRSVRLRGFDYAAPFGYFVTVCVHEKRRAFGRIVEGVMHHNAYGRIACEDWLALPSHFVNVRLDEWVVMPNHMHGILFLDSNASPDEKARFGNSKKGALGTIVGGYKSGVKRRINALRENKVEVWQRSFYDRIIRDEKELNAIRRYIIENPINWPDDEHYL